MGWRGTGCIMAVYSAGVLRLGWWSPEAFEALRLARNLGVGRGLRYNPAGPLEVPDAPLWVALGGVLQALGIEPMWGLTALTVAAGALLVLWTQRAAEQLGLGESEALAAAAVVALCPAAWAWSTSATPVMVVALLSFLLVEQVVLLERPGRRTWVLAVLLPLFGGGVWAAAALLAGLLRRAFQGSPRALVVPLAALAMSWGGVAAGGAVTRGGLGRLGAAGWLGGHPRPARWTAGAGCGGRAGNPLVGAGVALAVAVPVHAGAPGGDVWDRVRALLRDLVPALPVLGLLVGAALDRLATLEAWAAVLLGVALGLLPAAGVQSARFYPTDLERWSRARAQVMADLDEGYALRRVGLGWDLPGGTDRGARVYASDGEHVHLTVEARPAVYDAFISTEATPSLEPWNVTPEVLRAYHATVKPLEAGRFLHVLMRRDVSSAPVPVAAAPRKPRKSKGKSKRKGASQLPDGRWHRVPQDELSADQLAEIAALEALGYLDGVAPAVVAQRIEQFDPERALPGRNLYVSGHGPEALLTDILGSPLHRWHKPYDVLWPGATDRSTQDPRGHMYWRRVLPLENGHLIAMFEPYGVFELDKDSRVIWARHNGAHHDFHINPDTGHLWVLTSKVHVRRDIHRRRPIREDFVEVLDRQGNLLRSFSLLDAVRDSDPGLYRARRRHGDLFHTNALWFIDGPAATEEGPWRRGNLLLSSRVMDAVFVIDPRTQAVVWSQQGPWDMQHDPTLLPDGSLMVLDNRGLDGRSRVVRMDRASREITWSFDDRDDFPFYTGACGTVKRLDNGNTLVVESNKGRAFELGPDDAVVWMFNSPHRAASDATLVATLFDLIRVAPTYGDGWIDASTLDAP